MTSSTATTTTTTDPKMPIPPSLAHLDLSTLPHPQPNTLLLSQTLPPPTRKALLAHLSTTSAIAPLNDLLTTALHQRSPVFSSPFPHPSSRSAAAPAADWPSRVYALALELLRSGACAPSFPDVMREVTRRALLVEDEEPEKGEKEEKGVGTIVLPNGSYGRDGLPDVRVPRKVVDVGVGFLEEKLRGVVEVVDEEGAD